MNPFQTSTSRWFYCRLPRRQPRVRLFGFPPAGGAPVQYFAWPEHLPEEIELHVAQLPGRERRRHEPPLTDINHLLDELTSAVAVLADRSVALFGHSMGALLAFEVARRLRATDRATPCHLFVAGRRAPHVPFPYDPIHRLPDAEFMRLLQDRYGALPEAVRTNPELVEFFLPVIRADMTLLETYQYRPEPQLDCPITVYGGHADPSTTLRDLEAWAEQTRAGFRLRMFAGDHFFPQSHRLPLLKDISGCLTGVGAHSV